MAFRPPDFEGGNEPRPIGDGVGWEDKLMSNRNVKQFTLKTSYSRYYVSF